MRFQSYSILASLFLILFVGSTHAKSNEHFLVHFTSGDSYDVKIKGDTLTWTGLKGDDKGETRTNIVKHIALPNSVEVYQWTEKKTGSFITLVLDRNSMLSIMSGKGVKEEWLWQGKVQMG